MDMNSPTSDEVAIREVVERWAVARDAGLWDDLLAAWHDDGRMYTTWFRGTAPEFIAAVRKAFENGLIVHHFLGGTLVKVAGDRAIAQSKTTIANRVVIDGVECDLQCWARFYDFFERRDGRWAIVLRQPIYEKDRIDPVDPVATLEIDDKLLEGLPVGCRWLLYSQQKAGLPVIKEQVGPHGDLIDEVYAQGAAWLEGAPAPTD
jgi:hypothetical protein